MSQPLACGSIMPGPLTVRQTCCEGSLKKSSWKRTSPQIWQRCIDMRGIVGVKVLGFGFE